MHVPDCTAPAQFSFNDSSLIDFSVVITTCCDGEHNYVC